jgi:hypothetical protein
VLQVRKFAKKFRTAKFQLTNKFITMIANTDEDRAEDRLYHQLLVTLPFDCYLPMSIDRYWLVAQKTI